MGFIRALSTNRRSLRCWAEERGSASGGGVGGFLFGFHEFEVGFEDEMVSQIGQEYVMSGERNAANMSFEMS